MESAGPYALSVTNISLNIIQMRFLIGLIGIVCGLLIIKYREKIQRVSGPIAFAEKYLGPGGTFSMYLLTGCGTVILSILYAFGIIQSIIEKAASPFF